MTATTFDYRGYRQTLLDCGVPEKQAEGFTELARKQFEDQIAREAATREQVEREAAAREALRAEIQAELNTRAKLDEAERGKLAAKGDVANVRLEIEKVRLEIEQLRGETSTRIEKLRGEMNTKIGQLHKEIEQTRSSLLKWQIGIALLGFGTLGAIMAKGFGWLGF